MNVSLTPQLEKFIHGLVKTGQYQSSSEVVREALRLFHEHKARLADLRREVQKGIDELDRGKGIPFDDDLVEQIIRRGHERLAAERRPKKVG